MSKPASRPCGLLWTRCPALLGVVEVLTSVKARLERTLAEPADEDTHQMMLCCDEIGDALAALDADPKEAQ